VGVVRSAPRIKKYLTACQAIDQEYTTLAYPATICMECQAAEITDNESSVQTPEKSDVDQMREKIFKVKDPETMIQDEDTTVEEDSPTYSQDSQEYMHWHYRLNHPTHTVMLKMAKQKVLPRRITKILTDMGKILTDMGNTSRNLCAMTVVEQKQPEVPGETRSPSINKAT